MHWGNPVTNNVPYQGAYQEASWAYYMEQSHSGTDVRNHNLVQVPGGGPNAAPDTWLRFPFSLPLTYPTKGRLEQKDKLPTSYI